MNETLTATQLTEVITRCDRTESENGSVAVNETENKNGNETGIENVNETETETEIEIEIETETVTASETTNTRQGTVLSSQIYHETEVATIQRRIGSLAEMTVTTVTRPIGANIHQKRSRVNASAVNRQRNVAPPNARIGRSVAEFLRSGAAISAKHPRI